MRAPQGGAAREEWFASPAGQPGTAAPHLDEGRLHVRGLRVYGYVAAWDHGYGQPVVERGDDFALFHREQLLVQGTGDPFKVGVGMLRAVPDNRPAPMGATAQQAVAYYAQHGAVVAGVRAGEDGAGLWVAGCLLVGAGDPQAQWSVWGDWRRTPQGQMTLVAVLAWGGRGAG